MGRRSTTLPSLSIARSLGILAIGIGIQLVGAGVVKATPWDEDERAFLVYYILAMGSSAWVATRLRGIPMAPASFDLRIPPLPTFVPLAAGTIALVFGLVQPLVSMIPMSEETRAWMSELSSATDVWTLLALVIAAPILEELKYRGVILDGLLRRYSPLIAILVSSLLFGAAHLNPWQFVAGAVLGAFAGWVYHRSRSLIACVVIHMAANGSGFVLRPFLDVDAVLLDPDASLLELYGGVLPLLGWSAAFAAVFLLSVRSLKKRFDSAGFHLTRATEPPDTTPLP